jgi:stalled ribosome rescue protein Dom34
MQQYTIWIDHSHATIIDLSSKDYVITDIENENKFHPSKEQLKKFYHAVALEVENAERILLLGPGISKEEFKNHCESHHPHLAESIFKTKTTEADFDTKKILHAWKEESRPTF